MNINPKTTITSSSYTSTQAVTSVVTKPLQPVPGKEFGPDRTGFITDHTPVETTKIITETQTLPGTSGTTTTGTIYVTSTSVQNTKPQTANAVLALSFDDGPGPHTARLLDSLKEYNVRATFFVLGMQAEKYPDIVRRMVNEGHQLANHSYSHAYLSKVDADSRRWELSHTNDIFEQLTGKRATLMRPPGGFRNQAVYDEAARQGMATVFWDIDTVDWKYRDSDYIYNYLIDNTAPGKIILMHDIHETTVDAVIRALPQLIERGFNLVTVDELIDLGPGEVYPYYWN